MFQFHLNFNFLYDCFLRLWYWLCRFLSCIYGTLSLASWKFWEWTFYALWNKTPTWNLFSNSSYYLQNTYIKDKFFFSVILYRYDASKAVCVEVTELFWLGFILKLISVLKASNILKVRCKTIRWLNGQKYTPMLLWSLWLLINKLK